MATVLILGAGVMGTAFSFPLADAGNTVRLVGTPLDEEHIAVMQKGQAHPRLGIILEEGVEVYFASQLQKALREDVDLVVLGVSSAGVNWASDNLHPLLPRPVPILMLSKGLAVDQDTLISLPEKLRRTLEAKGLTDMQVGGVGGPCIAGELAVRRHTGVVASFTERPLLDWLVQLMRTDYYHVVPSSNLTGVESCAALKNLYALGIGAPQGMLERVGNGDNGALMHNLTSALFTQALQEMAIFEQVLCGRVESTFGLAGAGDLYVTCQAGRNSRMGRLLGLGMRYSEAKERHMAEDTVEGADLAAVIGPAVRGMFADGRLDKKDLPLAETIIAAVTDDEQLDFTWSRFHRKCDKK